jgi:GntR family transcriptional regulator, transcriptional repressor for pyruvate dehydrogenase complex
MIVKGQFRPGERLPIEPELSQLFGVSRSTIREALRLLSSQNLVIVRRGQQGGVFVLQPQASNVRSFLETTLGLLTGHDAITVDELVEVRSILDPSAASLAAVHRTENHLSSLREIVLREKSPSRDQRENWPQSSSFHEVVLDAANNRLLDMVGYPIFQTLRHRIDRAKVPAAFWSDVYRDHDKILNAIEAKESQTAESLMRSHVHTLAAYYRDYQTYTFQVDS